MVGSLHAFGDLGLLLLRAVVAVIFLYHALPKFKMAGMMAEQMGWSAARVRQLGVVEVVGALSVLSGLFFQVGALLLIGVMAGAIYYKTKKWSMGFSMQNGTGWEFDLLLLSTNIVFLTMGPGGIGL